MAGGGGGLDDELLALAGGSARTISLSSDEEDRVRSSSSKRAPPPTPSSLAKKRRLDLLDESDSGSDADAPAADDDEDAVGSSDEEGEGEAANPYPYQGIYKSARDMEALMNMTELEREDILARRRDEINKRRQKFELAALVKAQKAAAGATKRAVKKQQKKKKTRVVRGGRKKGGDSEDESDLSNSEEDEEEEEEEEDGDGGDSDFDYGRGGGAASAAKSRKKKLPGQTDAKSAKLSELRKKRSEKAAGISSRKTVDSDDDAKPRNRRGYASDSSQDDAAYSDFSDQDLYGSSSRTKSSRRAARRYSDNESPSQSTAEPTLADLNAARISRDRIESRLYAPRWKEALVGAFIRFSWGRRPRTDGRGEEQVYRIHQITDVLEKPGKFYDLSDDRSQRWCNVYLAFEHAGNEHEAKLNMLSRGEFTESERERWLAFLRGNKQRVPKAGFVANKADQLDKFFTALTEADIQKVLEHKKRVRAEAMSVMGGSIPTFAPTAGFNSPGVSTPTTSGPRNGNEIQTLEQRLAAVNERNRAMDRTRSSEVERKARANKIAALSAAKKQAEVEEKANSQPQEGEGEEGGVELTNAKPGVSGMGNGFVAVRNFATTVEVDLGDF